jgi:hypothetical protein
MNDPKSKINKTALRQAYKYYKIVASGRSCNDPVNGDCLLLLTCILGDLYPLRYSKVTVKIHDPIESHGLTYLMLARYCNQPEVVQYLLALGANPNTKSILNLPMISNPVGLVQPPVKPAFEALIHRIDGALSIPAPKNPYSEQCESLIELLEMDIEYCDRTEVERYFGLIREEQSGPVIGEYFDRLDTMYRLANRKHKFGYSLSGKIERFIQSVV